ncbi:MAG: hypothetical protein CMJ18_18420 [Phycisphaeraceae bacterium]|nr:hypothetical protein [Phycisphaeraceae bacterium]
MKPSDENPESPIPPVSSLIARLRRRQLELALYGSIRASARLAERARRLGLRGDAPTGLDEPGDGLSQN